jgi:hypothetical protein
MRCGKKKGGSEREREQKRQEKVYRDGVGPIKEEKLKILCNFS